MKNQNIADYLKPSNLINFQHADILEKAESLTAGQKNPEDKAEKIFYFIRDQIRYVFRASFEREKYFASNILKRKMGFCTQKAILFCALARAAKIPAGIYFYDIIDYTLPRTVVNLLNTNKLYRHGIAALYLNEKWIKYDATLDERIVKKNNLIPVEFQSDRDCLMRAHDKSGNKHVEYIADYGMMADVNYDQIIAWFKQNYPHLVKLEDHP